MASWQPQVTIRLTQGRTVITVQLPARMAQSGEEAAGEGAAELASSALLGLTLRELMDEPDARVTWTAT